MLRMPLIAVSVRLDRPWLARWLQALRSPILGAPLAPLPWQVIQVDSTTSLPLRACAAPSWGTTNAADAASARNATLKLKRLLRREDRLHGSVQLGVRRGNLGMALAFLQLRDELSLLALLFGCDVLESRPDLLLVSLVAVEAALRLEHVRARLGIRGTRRQRRRSGNHKHACFHQVS